ncbi:MAG: MBOAT family protein, partial [Paludibacteraceae bacterium]|nr:MBOAT family protein [Paludibacteraceae bacterium]
ILFTFQIYGDFSGYSDIAIGTAKLFGIKLMRNFNVPYFSRDIAEFWRRWHISLTTWFRDYVYIPLGGSRPNIPETIRLKSDKALEARYTKWIAVRNTFVIFLLSGFWHGANWTFVLWGAYHALLFVPLLLLNKNRRYRDTVATITLPDGTIKTKWLPSLKEAGQMLLTFAMAVFGWIIFRAQDISQFGEVISTICSDSLLSVPWLMNRQYYIPLLINIAILLIVEWLNRTKEHSLKVLPNNPIARILIYYGIFLLIFFFTGKNETFIYFQF